MTANPKLVRDLFLAAAELPAAERATFLTAQCGDADDLGKRPEAEEQYRKAMALFEKLAAEFPAVPAYRVGLGDSYYAYGSLVRDGGKMSDSLERIDKAIRTLAPIYEHEPREVKAKEALRNSHWGRAYAHDRLQQYAEAIADWNKAIELSPKQDQPGLRASRAISRIQAGQVAQAVAEVAELAKSPNANAAQWHDFACVYAVASGKLVDKKDEYATRALELLRLAVKAGYEDAANLKKDTYLDPLRAREDFKKLLAELEKPADPPEKK